MNYIKVTIERADYKKVQPFMGKFLCALCPVENEDGTLTVIQATAKTKPSEVKFSQMEADATEYFLPSEKKGKIAEIDAYDTSEAVNGFTYQGQTMWIDVDLRVKIQNGLNKCIELGEEAYPVWNGNVCYNIPCDLLNTMLAKLEVYAVKCMDNTNRHKANVTALTSLEDVKKYDFTTGYPEKLSF